MREIEFRGKAKHNNEWVYGFYSPLIWYPSLEQTPSIKTFKGGDMEINPETLGQYTGLTDKNGKKIFEGDIVIITEDGCMNGFIGIVEYNKSCFDLKNIEDYDVYEGLEYYEEKQLEVIGNIYDNCELTHQHEDKGE